MLQVSARCLAAVLLLTGCKSIQLEPVRIEVTGLAIVPCEAKLTAKLPPEQRKLVCYWVTGVARNDSNRPLRNLNLYGVIRDFEGTAIKEGRIGGLLDLESRKSEPFKLRVFFTREPRGPLKLEAFRARGMT